MYDYEGVMLNSQFGDLGISVEGRWNEISKDPDITEKSAPYHIRIGLVTTDDPGEKIEIRVIDIQPSKTPVSFYKANEVGVTKETFAYQKESESSYYSVLISDIYPDYQPITLKFQLHYKGLVEEYEVILQPEYWEDHRNNTVDGVMSV